MRQGLRLLASPGQFFNQLQWSSRHWMILVAFLGIAVVESQVGRQQALYHTFATILQRRWALSFDQAVWAVTVGRLALLLVASWAVMTALWLVGNLFGRRTSQRVLFRRLSIVLTVFLAGYTMHHLEARIPALFFATVLFYVWGAILGYFAIREQFSLSHLESVVVGLFAGLLVTASWHVTNHVTDNLVRNELRATPAVAPVTSVASRPAAPAPVVNRRSRKSRRR